MYFGGIVPNDVWNDSKSVMLTFENGAVGIWRMWVYCGCGSFIVIMRFVMFVTFGLYIYSDILESLFF